MKVPIPFFPGLEFPYTSHSRITLAIKVFLSTGEPNDFLECSDWNFERPAVSILKSMNSFNEGEARTSWDKADRQEAG